MAEPVIASIAAAIASGTTAALTDGARELVTRLVALVRDRFRRRKADQDALDTAARDPADADAVGRLAELLEQRMREEPEFAQQVRALWADMSAAGGEVTNIVSGTVHGSVVQARDVQGGITLHGPPAA